jgi:hypothetical protein
MVSRPARRVAPDAPTPFADAALDLREHGLAVLPLGGDPNIDDDANRKRRRPLVQYKGRSRFRPKTLERWAKKWPAANVGVLTGLSRVTVVDIDDPLLVDDMIARFGNTPLQISTPSGGVHLYYRANGERCANLRGEGFAVDIKGVGGMVVVPPSVRPDRGGAAYAFLAGSWTDLTSLPTMNPGALPAPAPRAEPSPTVPPDRQAVRQGERNDRMFGYCLGQVPHCGKVDELFAMAHAENAGYEPPLPDAEVEKVARNAWTIDRGGRNRVANSGQGPVVDVGCRWVARLASFSPKHGGDALLLYIILRGQHAARDKRGERFAVAARAMKRDQVLTWTEGRFRLATKVLVAFGLLVPVKQGGHGKGDVTLCRFGLPPPSLVSENDTNVTRHPAPAPPRVKAVESDNVMTASRLGGIVA